MGIKKIKIDAHFVGEEEPCFIIAEAGVNHNGSVNLAQKLIDAAKEANEAILLCDPSPLLPFN